MSEYTFWKDENGVSEFLWPKQQRDMAIYSQDSNIVIPAAFHLDIEVDRAKMEKAIASVYESYPVLRSLLYINDGKYYYRIVDNYRYKLAYSEAEGETYEERFQNALDIINDLASEPLDLTKDICIRSGLIRLDEKDHVLYMIGHPLVADGSSLIVAMDKIMSEYFGRPRTVPDGISYHEFAKRCLEYEKSEKGKKDQAFWNNELEGYEPYDVTRWYEGRNAEVSDYSQPLDYELFKKAAEQHKTSIYNIVLIGIHIAAHLSLGITDTTVVVPSSCRMKKDEIYIVGNLARNMPQRMTFGRDAKLSELLDISLRKVSKCLLHHHAGSLEPSCQLTLSYNNFRGGMKFEFKPLGAQLGNNKRITRDQIVTLVELDNTLSLAFGFDHRVSLDTLEFFRDAVDLTAKLLIEKPDSTVEDVGKILGK